MIPRMIVSFYAGTHLPRIRLEANGAETRGDSSVAEKHTHEHTEHGQC